MFGKPSIPPYKSKNPNTKASKRSKGFLEEDTKWASCNDDEEVISLLSFVSEPENTKLESPKDLKGKFYVSFFLAVFLLTNIIGTFANCSSDPEVLECIFVKNKSLEGAQDIIIYQVCFYVPKK